MERESRTRLETKRIYEEKNIFIKINAYNMYKVSQLKKYLVLSYIDKLFQPL